MRNGSAVFCPPTFVAFSHLPTKTSASATMLRPATRTANRRRLVKRFVRGNFEVGFAMLEGRDRAPEHLDGQRRGCSRFPCQAPAVNCGVLVGDPLVAPP